MTVRLFDTPDEIGRHAAGHLLAGLRTAHGAQRDYLVGCPTGRTPRPVYAALAEALRRDPQDLTRLVLGMMDEYAIGDGDAPLRLADPAEHFSCRGFAEREIVGPINAVLPKHFRIRPHNIWFPEVETPASYDGRIDDAGGIDFFLLASGSGDGHVAFNPPGSDPDSPTRIVTLAAQTRMDNLKTFPAFESLDAVPRYGVSVGLKTIRSARYCLLMLWGQEKREAFRRVTGSAGFDAEWPASIVRAAESHEIFADHAAADGRG